MIRPAVPGSGRTRQTACLAAAAIIAGGLAFASGARPASAAPADILLQAPLVGQIFTPPDSGDSGSWDCLPASLTMAISILEQSPADYGSVRRYMRTQSGIQVAALGQTYGVVEYSTAGRFSADKTYRPAAPDGWRTLVEGELSQGRPLVLYIADATKLEDSSGQALRPANESFTLAHAVLAVGLLNGGNTVVIDDPWNATPGGPGRQLRMTADAFAAAWGNTRFSGGTVYSNAGWNYIGFQPTSTTGVTPQPTPKVQIPTPNLLPTPVPTAPLGQTPIVTTKVIHRLGPENSTIDFQQPVVSGIAAAAAGAINATIQAKVDAFIADVDQQPVMPGDDPSSVTGSFKVAFVSSSLLSIEFNVENYGTGEGHGVELAGSLTFAVSSGAQIHLGDLFSDQSAGLAVLQTQAHNLALHLLVQRDGSYFGTLLADPAIWSMADFDKSWVFSPAGLQLSFSQGDIAAMADGLLTITIPWSPLAGVLKQDGPASSFISRTGMSSTFPTVAAVSISQQHADRPSTWSHR
jgi:hypothetical protein